MSRREPKKNVSVACIHHYPFVTANSNFLIDIIGKKENKLNQPEYHPYFEQNSVICTFNLPQQFVTAFFFLLLLCEGFTGIYHRQIHAKMKRDQENFCISYTHSQKILCRFIFHFGKICIHAHKYSNSSKQLTRRTCDATNNNGSKHKKIANSQ